MKIKKIWYCIRWHFNRALILWFLCCISVIRGSGQENPKPPAGLPEKAVKEAFEFIRKESWMSDTLKAHGLNPAFALAIVFPEIVRFSAIRDWAETKALEVLYVQYGSPYADFSIGRFQIKPSFAELLDGNSAGTGSPETTRLHRLRRLQDLKGQVHYLILFCKQMEIRFPEYRAVAAVEKLRFYATAYNTGFHKSKQQILGHLRQSEFYTTLSKPEKCMNYAEVAEWGYLKLVTGDG